MAGNSEDTTEWETVSEWKVVSVTNNTSYTGWRIISTHTGQATPLYEGMHRMICKLAWQYARRCMLDVEDLIHEGYLALLAVQEKYDPNRASRSTFVYWVVRNRFWQLAKRWPMGQELSESLCYDPSLLLENSHTFRETIHALSTEAKDVVKLILQCPREICEMAKNGTPEQMRKALLKILSKGRWGVELKTLEAVKEISDALNKNKQSS